eukprot:SAG31_NODE_136_length_23089_cov_8.825924_2_plen_898_part_00
MVPGWLCATYLIALLAPVGASVGPITWVSAGDTAGEALMVGIPVAPAPSAARPTKVNNLSAQLVYGDRKLQLAVLQRGNGSVTLALPRDFSIAPWGLQLCSAGSGDDGPSSSSCMAPAVPIYAADVMWISCDGAACAPGGTLRVFGRRLAFDVGGCRPYNSTLPIAGREFQLHLTATSHDGDKAATAAPVVLKATQQSCFDATFVLPVGLKPGTFTVSVANSVGGHLSEPAPPTQPDVRVLRIAEAVQRGTAKVVPQGMTGAAIVAALANAAKHNNGAVVQLTAGTYRLKAGDTLVVGDGVTLRGAGRLKTTLQWERQNLQTAAARKHLALIHGDNTTSGWTLQDLSIVAPQADHLNQYWGSAVVTDCGAEGSFSDGNWHRPQDADGFYAGTSACSGMVIERVKITIDKVCPPGTAWPAETDYGRSCGGYTEINSSYPHSMLAGVVSAVRILGQDAVFQDSEIVHYGTCGSNVAFALEVNSARNVVVRRNTLRYGCTAYGIGSTDGIVFAHNQLVPYKNASGGGSNVQIFGARQQMRRMFFANNTQLLCDRPHTDFCPPSHLETMTTDGGAGWYEGHVARVASDGVTLKTVVPASAHGAYNADATSKRRPDWRLAAVLLLSGPAAGQWRRAELQGASNDTWKLDYPFATPPEPYLTYIAITKLLGQLLFVGNRWLHSHFQLYAECLDCVVAENHFEDSFAASWGMNPHNLVGGWQPNMQIEWLRNTVKGGTGITLMTSDQPIHNGVVNASYNGSLDTRIVLRGNLFHGGGGVQLGLSNQNPNPKYSHITSLGNVLVDSNVLSDGACNLTTQPMPAGADIANYELCSAARPVVSAGNCSFHDIVLHNNVLEAVRSCGHPPKRSISTAATESIITAAAATAVSNAATAVLSNEDVSVSL